MNAEDLRKILDAWFDKLTPARAQEIAKGLLGEDRREQVQKMAAELMESAQRNRDRVKDLIAREVASQTKNMGVATQKEVDALKKRVRDLERAAGLTKSGAAKKPTTRKRTTAKRPASKTTTASHESSPTA